MYEIAFTGNFGWTEVQSMTELPYVGLCGNSYFGFWRSGRCGRSFEKVSSYYSVFWVHHQKLVLVNFSMSNLSFTSGIPPTSSLVYDLYSKIREIFYNLKSLTTICVLFLSYIHVLGFVLYWLTDIAGPSCRTLNIGKKTVWSWWESQLPMITQLC